ncbi:MAG: RagB/SusD family nutrient uptake outer membrane protein [Muribaculaceae bacterium]|nr:RagB/SusD family nutrient uptake outer membrane protein [Muribaculaceae bacterium]
MNLKKYLLFGGVALGLGMTSCVGDLDLEPNDPNLVDTSDPNFKANALGICYSGIAVSGISGPGSSYVGGLDPGTSAYLRTIFTLGEFPTDELTWIWPNDEGGSIGDLIACSWSSSNSIVYGAYYRLLGHIAICNQFLANTADDTDAETIEMRAQARVLRAYSYYNMIDLYGQSSFITEEAEVGEQPRQASRLEVFNFIEQELTEIVDQKLISENPLYGRVGLDGAEALLARLYLNAEVYSGTARWADCQTRCENIIRRHQGGGFVAKDGTATGLAKEYLYLFCEDNKQYMPGGSNKAENEILFGISFDQDMVQSYGGPTFIVAGTITNSHYCPRQNYGCSGEWACIKGIKQMAERFYGLADDKRDDLWLRGYMPAGSDANGSWDAEDYTAEFLGFTGGWATTGGNAIIKFTGNTITKNPASVDKNDALTLFDGAYGADGKWLPNYDATAFMSTDQPIIRLADIYLMYTECYITGRVGDSQKALNYINYVSERAGNGDKRFNSSQLTVKTLMDERSRELYLESVRRTDLIRNKMFVGPQQTVWQVKGNINNMEGTRIDDRFALYPIPNAVLNSQPDFKQNPGY